MIMYQKKMKMEPWYKRGDFWGYLLGQLIGAGAGYLIGGPPGAAIGAGIGGTVGSSAFAETPVPPNQPGSISGKPEQPGVPGQSILDFAAPDTTDFQRRLQILQDLLEQENQLAAPRQWATRFPGAYV